MLMGKMATSLLSTNESQVYRYRTYLNLRIKSIEVSLTSLLSISSDIINEIKRYVN